MTRWSALALVVVAVGCNTTAEKSDTTKTESKEAAMASADNTKKNERDRDRSELTPGDQGENDVDRGITQQIRKALVKSDSLSMTAKNVKIITVDNVVTLRGPVKSDKEKNEIADVATKADGVKRVDNQLEIAAN